MSISNGYCTLDEFKAYAEISSTNATDDGVLEDIIEAVSRFMDAEIDAKLYKQDSATKYFTPEMSDMLLLDPPIRSVTTLKTDDDGDGVYETTWEAADYVLKPDNGDGGVYFWIELGTEGSETFPVGIQKAVELVGDFGYSTTPSDLKMCCLEIATNVEGRRHGQGSEAVQVTAGGVVITPKDITAYARKVLDHYRRIR